MCHSESKLVEAVNRCGDGVFSLADVEDIIIREALSWTKERGWRDVCIEADGVKVIQMIHGSKKTYGFRIWSYYS